MGAARPPGRLCMSGHGIGSLWEGIRNDAHEYVVPGPPGGRTYARVCTLSRETGQLGSPHVLAGAESAGAKGNPANAGPLSERSGAITLTRDGARLISPTCALHDASSAPTVLGFSSAGGFVMTSDGELSPSVSYDCEP